jgi:hypothetical protein
MRCQCRGRLTAVRQFVGILEFRYTDCVSVTNSVEQYNRRILSEVNRAGLVMKRVRGFVSFGP